MTAELLDPGKKPPSEEVGDQDWQLSNFALSPWNG